MENLFPNRRWIIIPSNEVQNINFNEVIETSSETLRYSLDGTKTFVKYDVMIIENDITNTFFNPETLEETTTIIPSGIYGRPSFYNNQYTEYDYPQICDILNGPEWNNTETI